MALHLTGSPELHALWVGKGISGRIPHGDTFVDVTPEWLFADTQEELVALADSIEIEHAVRGTHPVQTECEVLGMREEIHPGGLSFSDEVIAAHQAAHAALNAKIGR